MALEHLDRHRAIEARVTRLVDFAHATRSGEGHNLVRTEARARLKSHRFLPREVRRLYIAAARRNRSLEAACWIASASVVTGRSARRRCRTSGIVGSFTDAAAHGTTCSVPASCAEPPCAFAL